MWDDTNTLKPELWPSFPKVLSPKVMSPNTKAMLPEIYRHVAQDPGLFRPNSCLCAIIENCTDTVISMCEQKRRYTSSLAYL